MLEGGQTEECQRSGWGGGGQERVPWSPKPAEGEEGDELTAVP